MLSRTKVSVESSLSFPQMALSVVNMCVSLCSLCCKRMCFTVFHKQYAIINYCKHMCFTVPHKQYATINCCRHMCFLDSIAVLLFTRALSLVVHCVL